MQGFNKVIIAGNLTRDLELRFTPKGTPVAQSALAVNRTWTSESGEKKEEVTFVDFKIWGRGAEVLAQYIKKGRPLLIEGRLTTESWDDKQTGQKRTKTVVLVEGFTFLGGGQGQGGQEGGDRTGAYDKTKTARQNARAQASDNDGGTGDPPPPDDDVPF